MLIRPGAIGDCILSLPALEFLRADFTEVWIPGTVVPLIQFADSVRSIADTGLDRVAVGNMEFPAKLRAELGRFDEVVTWYGANRSEFRRAVIRVHPRCEFLQALPGADSHCHATDFFLKQVGAPLGGVPRVHVGPIVPRGTLVIHPFSGGRGKNWPLEKFEQVAAGVRMEAEWTAGPEEQLDGAHRFDNLLGLAQWMGGGRAYLGNDSGITHLAAAIGMRGVALFGPTDPQVWAPRSERLTWLRQDPISEIGVDAVLERLASLVN